MSAIDDLVRSTIVGLRPARSGWGRTKCPFCITRIGKADRRSSFAFWFPRGIFKCFRCGIKGLLGGYVTEHKEEDFESERYRSVKAPSWFLSSVDPEVTSSLAAQPGIRYAESRGFDAALRAAVGMGVAVSGKYAESIVVPHRDARGDWWGFTSRKWYGKCDMPYRYPDGMSRERMFNDQALLVDTDDPCLWMEGVLDSVLYWPDVTAGLGKPIEDHVVLAKKAKRPIAMVLDGDAWREGERFMMRLRLEGLTAGAVRMPPGRDPNNTDFVDPSDIRRAALASLTATRAVRVLERR